MGKWYKINTKDPNYLYFLFSLVLMLVLPPLTPRLYAGLLIVNLTYGLVLVMSVVYAGTNARDFFLLGLLAAVMYGLFLYESKNVYFSSLSAALTLVFFSIILLKILRYILLNPIGVNEIYACITGYLILGVLGAALFFIIDQTTVAAFRLDGPANFYDFLYLSYITLTSVGYGDISPVAPLAKSAAILISVAGQLYLTILIAIIIGKFFAANEEINVDP
ncbi:MAG: potassium channel family protein [Bacteroidota bacterium]